MGIKHIHEAVSAAREDIAAYRGVAESLQVKSAYTGELYTRIVDIVDELNNALAEAQSETRELALMGDEAEKDDLVKALGRLMSVGLHETENSDAQTAIIAIQELIDKNAMTSAGFKHIENKTNKIPGITEEIMEVDKAFQVQAVSTKELQGDTRHILTHLDAFLIDG